MKVGFHCSIDQERELEYVGKNMSPLIIPKHVTINTSNDKSQITVLACVNASGWSIPHMVIFKRSNLTEDLIKGEVPDTLYGLSKTGWMDGDLFTKWF